MADTVNKIIVTALRSLGLPIAERLYEGEKTEYITFNFADDQGLDFGDDVPGADVAYMQVHYFCPYSKDYKSIKRQIRQMLQNAGFTWPEVTDASDDSERIRHFVYECEIENTYELEVETPTTTTPTESEVIQNG